MIEFPAPVLSYFEGGMTWHYIPLPDDIADELEDGSVRRVIVGMNGVEYNRAIQRNRRGERYFITSRSMLREVGAVRGDVVIVAIRPDPEPDNPALPDELAEALNQDPEAYERFHEMTPGKRRGLAHYVDSAKRPETRTKRAVDLAYKLRTYTLYGDRE